jgi:hypothetical protein
VKQVQYLGSTVLEWPVGLNVASRFLRGTFELIHILVREKELTATIVVKILSDNTQNLVAQAPSICAPLM